MMSFLAVLEMYYTACVEDSEASALLCGSLSLFVEHCQTGLLSVKAPPEVMCLHKD